MHSTVVAVPMSAFGTKPTSPGHGEMSASKGESGHDADCLSLPSLAKPDIPEFTEFGRCQGQSRLMRWMHKTRYAILPGTETQSRAWHLFVRLAQLTDVVLADLLFREPFAISVHIDHRHGPAELKL